MGMTDPGLRQQCLCRVVLFRYILLLLFDLLLLLLLIIVFRVVVVLFVCLFWFNLTWM